MSGTPQHAGGGSPVELARPSLSRRLFWIAAALRPALHSHLVSELLLHAVPLRRFSVVLRDAATVRVHETEVVLCGGIALLGGETEQFHGLGVILRHASVDTPNRPVVDT